ncbi:MAG: 2Fe-2S iron-sulfur cluster-binding protein, partial [Nitrospirae bacterium]|nr:2Fe-2S iron-sulfur cluster-binding protein [Nitrospirota bacterium]
MKQYKFRIKRFDPEKDSSPQWKEFTVEMEPTERALDGLIKIKETIDGSLTFRKSCAHG